MSTDPPDTTLSHSSTAGTPAMPEAVARRLRSAVARLAPGTRRAYHLALTRFTEFAAGEAGLLQAPWWELILPLVARGRLVTADVVDRYASEISRNLASATVAQRLAAVRWALALLDEAGAIDWTLKIRSPRVHGFRDVRGPAIEDVRALLAAAECQIGILSRRDRALVGLLFLCGLRRGEVTTLRIRDWDPERRRLAVLGKARTDRSHVTVPAGLATDINAYLAARGSLPSQTGLDGPLLAGHGPHCSGGPLGGDGILRALTRLSKRARLRRLVRPHGLRHAAITAALDAHQGDVRRVARFSRHAKVETVMVYDDARRDEAGEVSTTLEQVLATGSPSARNGDEIDP